MRIDFFGDIACPWSHLGWRRLRRALAERSIHPRVLHWRPFQLNPDLPVTGINRADYMVQKFGNLERVREVEAAIGAAMAADDIAIHLDRIMVTPHTALGHRLMLLAAESGREDAFLHSIFSGYFLEGLNIGDPEILQRLAMRAGLMEEASAAELARTSPHPLMQESESEARRMGIKAVPYCLFNNAFSLAGAHDPVAFLPLVDLCLLNPQPEAVSVLP